MPTIRAHPHPKLHRLCRASPIYDPSRDLRATFGVGMGRGRERERPIDNLRFSAPPVEAAFDLAALSVFELVGDEVFERRLAELGIRVQDGDA